MMKTKKENRNAAIWMDYSVAYVTELKNGHPETTIVRSAHSDPGKGLNADRNGSTEEDRHVPYYASLEEIISGCDEVILYGPGNAKLELHKVLRANYLFAGIRIILIPAGEMTREEQHHFFRRHFINSRINR